jgi:hypothetical protein
VRRRRDAERISIFPVARYHQYLRPPPSPESCPSMICEAERCLALVLIPWPRLGW